MERLFPPANSRHEPERILCDQFVPREELEEKKRDLKYLQFQLTMLRVDNTELRMRQNELCPVLAEVLRKSDEELHRTAPYTVQMAADGLTWETVTEMCCLGGCDMGVYTFPTERDALLFAALLKAVGYRPSHNTACSSCYAEYMRDCI